MQYGASITLLKYFQFGDMHRYLLTGCVLSLLLSTDALLGQPPARVTAIKLRTETGALRVHPFESIAIQVVIYGEQRDSSGRVVRTRLQRGPATFFLQDPDAGWLSKPFRLQGNDGAVIYQSQQSDLFSRQINFARDEYLSLDAVMFTASRFEGEVELSATLDGVIGSITIEVDANAPSLVSKEETTFEAEKPSKSHYRKLAEYHSPYIAQETWFQPKSDYLARFDLDGDKRGDNNWENTPVGSSQAYVYYTVVESETHWFLIYNFFHPRDYSDKCVAASCHENDNEGLILTVVKDGSEYGKPLVMETFAHNKIYSYRIDWNVQDKLHDIDGEVVFYQETHPVVFIQSGGHGVYAPDKYGRYSLEKDIFLSGTGVTYIYKSEAERPRHPADRLVGYELLPIYEHWWLPAHEDRRMSGHMFSNYYSYQPFGGRPRPQYTKISGAFLGRMHGVNEAKPFWGWHDGRSRKKQVLSTGQWALDPAYALSRNLTIPEPFSLEYVFNPYLGIE